MPAELTVVGDKYRNGNHRWSIVTFSQPSSAQTQKREISTRIAVKAKRKFLFIDVAEIFAIEASGNYVVLRHKSGKHRVKQAISDIAEKLQSFGFVRINRSLVVNSRFAKEVQALQSGNYLLRVEGGAEYTVTRTHKNNLRFLAALWLGPQPTCDM